MQMLRKSVKHWSLRKRLYLIAFIAGFSVVQSIMVNFFLLNGYNDTVEHISKGELSKLDTIAHIFKELADTHTQLFNLLSHASQTKDEQHVYLLGGKLIDRIDTLTRSVSQNELNAMLARRGQSHKISFKDLKKDLTNYRNSASVAIEMITVNDSLSDKYMLKATSNFNTLNSLLSNIMSDTAEHIDEEMTNELALISSIYWPLTIMVVLVAIFLAPLIVRILRDLSQHFSWIEHSLNSLRDGQTDIQLPVMNENTEMGRIISSIEKFRDALIRLQSSKHELSEKNRLLIEESERRLLTEKELRRSLMDLSRAIDAAQASNQTKSLFLANMSHEIRTPLNAVLGMAQVLQTTKLDSEQTDYVDTLYSQGHHLLALLNSVLDYSKMESGTFKLEYSAFKLDMLIDEVFSLYKNQPSQNNIDFVLEIEAGVKNDLYGDPLRIRQVLINLLSNAYKFTPQGEIKIHISNYEQNSSCHIASNPRCPNKDNGNNCLWNGLYISVTDSGIGIAKDKQDYIFQNFTQADESFTRQFGGTGIGLAICKQLVELMDGEIGVESTLGEGARFWFRICLPSEGWIEQEQAG